MAKQLIRRIPAATLVAAAAFTALPCLAAATEAPARCADLRYLIEQSRSRFAAILSAAGNGGTTYGTTFAVPGASSCAIHEDAEKLSYQCTWEFVYGDPEAREAFDRLAAEMRRCIGDQAEEQADRAVNHPDIYAAYYYRLRGSAARVSLKHKGQLKRTLVSIIIDGFEHHR